MFNKQTAFDTALNGIRAQGKPSLSADPVDNYCLYRAPDGSKCAIGHLIPDDKYSPDMEMGGIYQRIHEICPIIGVETADWRTIDFLSELQKAHDRGRNAPHDQFLPGFEERMVELANNYDLNYTPRG